MTAHHSGGPVGGDGREGGGGGPYGADGPYGEGGPYGDRAHGVGGGPYDGVPDPPDPPATPAADGPADPLAPFATLAACAADWDRLAPRLPARARGELAALLGELRALRVPGDDRTGAASRAARAVLAGL
ncbi:hypothetical protein RKE29_17705, partial [Streptomyces sp. B1866]|nr:hypothetical protein [Streptomyces sp. B1866]